MLLSHMVLSQSLNAGVLPGKNTRRQMKKKTTHRTVNRQRWVLYTELYPPCKRINKTKTTLNPCETHKHRRTHTDACTHSDRHFSVNISKHTTRAYILRSLSRCLRFPVLRRTFSLLNHIQNWIQNKSICANGTPWRTLSLPADVCEQANVMAFKRERDVRFDEHTMNSNSSSSSDGQQPNNTRQLWWCVYARQCDASTQTHTLSPVSTVA